MNSSNILSELLLEGLAAKKKKIDELTMSGMAAATTSKNFPQFVVPLGQKSPAFQSSSDFYDMLKKSGRKRFNPKKNKFHKTPMLRWDEFMRAYPRTSVWYRFSP